MEPVYDFIFPSQQFPVCFLSFGGVAFADDLGVLQAAQSALHSLAEWTQMKTEKLNTFPPPPPPHL